MAEYLVVRLNASEPDTGSWVIVDDSGVQLEPPAQGPLSAAAFAARHRRVVALVPAGRVYRASVEVPVKGQARLSQVLPYAMEEQLAEDVDLLHFASGRRDSEARVRVAVVRREDMDHWLAALSAAGLEASAIYAESDGLDAIPGTAVLLLEPEQTCFRDERGELAVADPVNSLSLLKLWLAHYEGDSPPNLIVYADPELPDGMLDELEPLRSELQSYELRQLADGALPRLAARIVVDGGVNLMQGGYARRSDLARYWPAWRLAAALLLGVGLAAAGATMAEIWQLDRRAAQLETAIQQAYRYTFPGAREFSGTRAELESRLRASGQASEQAERTLFLDSMQSVARAVRESGADTRLEGIDYRSGVMELRVRVPNVETLDRIQKSIAAGGQLKAEIQSANADGDKILGRLRLETAGA